MDSNDANQAFDAAQEFDATQEFDALNPAVHRRLTVAVSWAMARAATLDCLEQFEESYALNEEFREWLLCLDEHPELLDAAVLMVPRDLHHSLKPESDGLLEI